MAPLAHPPAHFQDAMLHRYIFRNRLTSAILIGVMAASVSSAQANANDIAFPAGKQVPSAFHGIIGVLWAQTQTPILLPTKMVTAPNTIVGEIVDVTRNEYTVQMSMGDECHTGMYCRFGTIHGDRITPQTPPLTGSRLVFEPGVAGFFTPAV